MGKFSIINNLIQNDVKNGRILRWNHINKINLLLAFIYQDFNLFSCLETLSFT